MDDLKQLCDLLSKASAKGLKISIYEDEQPRDCPELGPCRIRIYKAVQEFDDTIITACGLTWQAAVEDFLSISESDLDRVGEPFTE